VIRQGLADYSQERLITVNLDENHKVIGFEVVRVGPRTMEARVVEVFSSTLHFDASAVVVIHFVPQGDGVLGVEDRRLAERLRAAAEMMGVEMLDYLTAGQ
jgi:DNA repair protein RadC